MCRASAAEFTHTDAQKASDVCFMIHPLSISVTLLKSALPSHTFSPENRNMSINLISELHNLSHEWESGADVIVWPFAVQIIGFMRITGSGNAGIPLANTAVSGEIKGGNICVSISAARPVFVLHAHKPALSSATGQTSDQRPEQTAQSKYAETEKLLSESSELCSLTLFQEVLHSYMQLVVSTKKDDIKGYCKILC